VKKLVLTHVPARSPRDTSELEREARAVFPATIIARDGMEIDIPFEPSPGAEGGSSRRTGAKIQNNPALDPKPLNRPE